MASEPSSLTPFLQRSSSGNYLLGNLYRNIYKFENEKGLVPDLGSCKPLEKKLQCTLAKNLKWSQGSPLTSSDFVNTYKEILTPGAAAPRADLLFKIKNAEAIYNGTKPPASLGVTAPNPHTLIFEFENEASEFEYHLASIILAPFKKDQFNGPYKLKEWKKGQKIVLESNEFYPTINSTRPSVEFIFVEEDSVALQLYEKNELQLLRRLPTLFIPKFKTRGDFVWNELVRFDYIGFGPELDQLESYRKALTYSLNFPELQKIFSSESLPGCIGLPAVWFPENKIPCYSFDLQKVPPLKPPQPKLVMMFSALGGDDHRRATEWLQSQWKKQAQLSVALEAKENKILLQILKNNPPTIFRKGGTPERPTCMAVLESFLPDSPENYVKLNSPDLLKTVQKLRQSKNASSKKKLCLEGVDLILQSHRLIPLGGIHFSLLIKENFKGWKLNQLNELDLSNLRFTP